MRQFTVLLAAALSVALATALPTLSPAQCLAPLPIPGELPADAELLDLRRHWYGEKVTALVRTGGTSLSVFVSLTEVDDDDDVIYEPGWVPVGEVGFGESRPGTEAAFNGVGDYPTVAYVSAEGTIAYQQFRSASFEEEPTWTVPTNATATEAGVNGLRFDRSLRGVNWLAYTEDDGTFRTLYWLEDFRGDGSSTGNNVRTNKIGGPLVGITFFTGPRDNYLAGLAPDADGVHGALQIYRYAPQDQEWRPHLTDLTVTAVLEGGAPALLADGDEITVAYAAAERDGRLALATYSSFEPEAGFTVSPEEFSVGLARDIGYAPGVLAYADDGTGGGLAVQVFDEETFAWVIACEGEGDAPVGGVRLLAADVEDDGLDDGGLAGLTIVAHDDLDGGYTIGTIGGEGGAGGPNVAIDPAFPIIDCDAPTVDLYAYDPDDFGGGGPDGEIAYDWSTGETGAFITAAAAGEYTVYATDLDGNTDTATVFVEDYGMRLELFASPDTVVRGGQPVTLTAEAFLEADTTTIVYTWADGTTGPERVVDQTGGTFVVTAEAPYAACAKTDSIRLTLAAGCVLINHSPEPVLTCATDTIELTATVFDGDTEGRTFKWNTGATTDVVYATEPGEYWVCVTGGDPLCADTARLTVEADYARPTAALTPEAPVLTCDDVDVLLDASGSTGDRELSFVWTDPIEDDFEDGEAWYITDPMRYVEAPGTYEVVVAYEDNACADTARVTVTGEFTPPSVAIETPAGTAVTCDVDSVTLRLTTDLPPFTGYYYWGDTFDSTSVRRIGNADTLWAYVQGTNAALACRDSASVTVTVDTIAPTAVIDAETTVLTCDVFEIALDASASRSGGGDDDGGDELAFSWTVPGGDDDDDIDGGLGTEEAVYFADAPGEYTVTVTNLRTGCTHEESITLTADYRAPSIAVEAPAGNTITCDVDSVTLRLTTDLAPGTGYYYWGDIADTAAVRRVGAPGTYWAYASGTAGGPACTDSVSVTVTRDTTGPTAVISAPATELTCERTAIDLDASGSTGGEGLLYYWNDATDTASTLTVTTAGTYVLRVVHPLSGCADETTIEITQSAGVPTAVIDASADALTCDITAVTLDASASASADPEVGEMTFSWSTGATAPSIDVTAAGTYTVGVTDVASGCSAEASVTVAEDVAPPVAVITAPATVLDCATPEILLDARGSSGADTLLYFWGAAVDTASTLLVAEAGTYTLTVVNPANGCSATDAIAVTRSDDGLAVDIEAGADVLTCATTAIVLQAIAGDLDAELTYAWTPGGGTDATLVVTEAGTYVVTVIDEAAGCSGRDSITITRAAERPTAVITASAPQLDCDNPAVTLSGTRSTGPGALRYRWLTSEEEGVAGVGGATDDSTFVVEAADTYRLVVTAAVNDCADTARYTLGADFERPVVAIAASAPQLTCATPAITLDGGDTRGEFGTEGVEYRWRDGSATAGFRVSAPGTYGLRARLRSSGCVDSAAYVVTGDFVAPLARIDAPGGTEIGCDTDAVILDANGSSGRGALGFAWSTTDTAARATVTRPGTVTLVVTDGANGCRDTAEVDIAGLTAETVATAFLSGAGACAGQEVYLIDYSVFDAAAGDVDFAWDFGDGATSTERDPVHEYFLAGDYTVTLAASVEGCRPIEVTKPIEVRQCLLIGGGGEVEARLSSSLSADGGVTVAARLPGPSEVELVVSELTTGVVIHRAHFAKTTGLRERLQLPGTGQYVIALHHRFGVTTLRGVVLR